MVANEILLTFLLLIRQNLFCCVFALFLPHPLFLSCIPLPSEALFYFYVYMQQKVLAKLDTNIQNNEFKLASLIM